MAILGNDGRVFWALLRIDLKQGWRHHLAGTTWRGRVLQFGGLCFALAFLTLLHACAFALLVFGAGQARGEMVGVVVRGLNAGLWSFLIFIMLSGGLARALAVLHEQEDSRLLLSAPIAPKSVLAARLFGNALQSCLVDGFIILPWINVLVYSSKLHWPYLWGYPVWFALAVIVTCLDGLLSFGAIRWLGFRRARIVAQVVPFLLVFGFALGFGAFGLNLVAPGLDAQGFASPAVQAQLSALGDSPLGWIPRAALGEPLYLLPLLALAGFLAAVTLHAAERPFIEGTQQLLESGTPAGPERPFRGGLFQLDCRRNLRLLVRTPMLLVQCLAQLMTPVGITFVIARHDRAGALLFMLLFMTGVLAGIVAIALATIEECEDLLLMSPHRPHRFRYARIVAACRWSLVLIGLGVVFLVGLGELRAAAGLLLAGVPLGFGAAVVGESFAIPLKPGQKPKLASDPIMLVPLLGMQIVCGAVAGGILLAVQLSWFALILALLATYCVVLIPVGLVHLRKPLV